jgi:predicted RND superfamily exporter protein
MFNERIITKYRLLFIIAPLVISLLMLIPLMQARINPDLNEYLPDKIEPKVNLSRLDKIFGKNEPVIIFFKADDVLNDSTLKRIKNLSKEFNRMKEFDRVMSLFDAKNIRGEDGAMIVDPVIRRIPRSDSRREQLREEIKKNDLAYGLIVSTDFKYTIIMVSPTEQVLDDDAIALIENLLLKYPGNEKVYLSGYPYLKHEIQAKATRDFAILMPLGLIIMIIFLYLSFHEKRGVFLPFSVVLMSIILAMGLMPLFGWDLSLIAILVPIMMIAIANNYGVHIISRYQELNALHPRWSMKKIVAQSIADLHKPILLTALTTIAGVLGMVVHIMLPAKQMGIVSAIGIAFALLLSLTFIPAVLLSLKKGKAQKSFTEDRHTLVDKMLTWAGNITTKKPGPIIVFFIAVFIILGLGVFRLKVSINNENLLPKSHPVRISTRIANEHFGGTKNIVLLFEGDIKDPAILKKMDGYEKELKKMPEVGSVMSLATIIRTMSRALNDPGDPNFDKIPDSRQAVAQYLEFYSMSGDPDDFERIVNFNYSKAVMNIQFRAYDKKTFNKVENKIRSLTKNDEQVAFMAGMCLVEKGLAQAIIRGQINSLIFAVVAIILLLVIIFRAFTAGLMGSLPLIYSLVCTFGVMGWIGIRLDIATSLLSSIAIGIGIDYTIHLFWRLKTELVSEQSYAEAVIKTLKTTGRGITINAFSVMLGFVVLFASAMVILKTFALLIIFSLLLCLLCALIFIPALSIIIRPKFLENSTKKYDNENKN